MSDVLSALGLKAEESGCFAGEWRAGEGSPIDSIDPSSGARIGRVRQASLEEYDAAVAAAAKAFGEWRRVPAPVRGQAVRAIAEALRAKKRALAELVTRETGKIIAEAEGEVQEMIDVADFAVGLSRQLAGVTMPSERPDHRMMEQWHPLGVVGCITAFNFPVAVWSWNALIAAVCGDAVVWKPSEETPLTSVAVTKIASDVLKGLGHPPIFALTVGGRDMGARMAADARVPLVSATGSCAMGRAVGESVARRLGRSLLELGGNNAVVVLEDANLDLAVRAVLFGAVGTAGQRCTSTRRVLAHRSIARELTRRLVDAYGRVTIGDPLAAGTLMGPLINARAVADMQKAIATAKAQGATVLCGGERLERPGFFVKPAIVRAPRVLPIAREETFAPILYVFEIDGVDDAILANNDVRQGLSSAIFTQSVASAERFLSPVGSDCGIANVNLGTSGAEIGGAFGGEKDTGGGRESGSDSWKAYMRRQTCTINYGSTLPLAQGVTFGD